MANRSPRPTTDARPEDAAFRRWLAAGDPEALARVFDATAPKLLLVAAHLARDAAEAEDLVQTTFLQALRDRERFDATRPVLPWLTSILANRARDRSRRAGRETSGAEGAVEGLADRGAEPLERLAGEEVVERVTRAVDGLPEPYRDVLVLRLVHGLSPTQIAHALGRSPSAVRTQLARGLERLRARLPKSLVLSAALALDPRRGLEAVRATVLREAVLQEAGAATAATAAAGTLGTLISMKTAWIAGAAGVALVASLWMLTRPEGDPAVAAPVPERVADVAPVREADRPAPVAAPPREPASSAARRDAEPVDTRTGASLEVVVHDAGGAPVAEVGLDLVLADANGPALALRTDAAGEARFAGLAAGRYVLLPDRAEPRPVALEAGETRGLAVVLPAGVHVVGEVVDLLGRPVGGARVQRVRREHPDFAQDLAVADAEGRFEVRDLPPDQDLVARAPGYQPAAPEGLDGEPGETEQVRLVMGALGQRLTGVVLDGDGAPVPDVLVGIAVDEDARGSHEGLSDLEIEEHDAASAKPLDREAFFVRAGPDGRFATDEVPAGDAFLFARGPAPADPRVATARVRVTRERPHEVRLHLAPGAAVHGTVRDEAGGVFAGVVVRATWDGSDEYGSLEHDLGPLLGDRATRTDADGAYRLTGLLPGEHDLYVGAQDGVLFRGGAELAAGELAGWDPVLAPHGELAVRVLDPDGAPLVGWGVEAAAEDGRWYGERDALRTDAGGRVRWPHLPRAEHAVVVRAPLAGGPRGLDPVPALRRAGVRPGEAELVLRLGALPSAALTGRVTHPDGRPVARGDLDLAPAGPRDPRDARSLALVEGRFEAAGLPPGPYVLRAWVDGYPRGAELGRWTLSAGQTTDAGELRLPQPGWLVVSLAVDDGGAIDDPELALLDATGDDVARLRRVDGGDGWRSSPVAPGEYVLAVEGDDLPPHREPVSLGPGERRLALVVPRGGACVLEVAFGPYVAGWSDPRAEQEARLDVEVRDEAGQTLVDRRLTRPFEGGRREARFVLPLAPGRYALTVVDQTVDRREDRTRLELAVEVPASGRALVPVDLRR